MLNAARYNFHVSIAILHPQTPDFLPASKTQDPPRKDEIQGHPYAASLDV